jgi:hypothetical protein
VISLLPHKRYYIVNICWGYIVKRFRQCLHHKKYGYEFDCEGNHCWETSWLILLVILGFYAMTQTSFVLVSSQTVFLIRCVALPFTSFLLLVLFELPCIYETASVIQQIFVAWCVYLGSWGLVHAIRNCYLYLFPNVVPQTPTRHIFK